MPHRRTRLDRPVKCGSATDPAGRAAYDRRIERPLILVVCTANQCRSPLAEALLRARLAERGVEATIGSAGLMRGGMPATDTGVEVLVGRGLPAGDHRSRNIAEPDVGLEVADLVIGMERRHVQEAVIAAPALRQRSFTLIDLVRRAEAADARRDGEAISAWAARLSAGRTTADLLGSGDDEVADPVGGTREDYEATADLLDDLLARLVARAFPLESPLPADDEPAPAATEVRSG